MENKLHEVIKIIETNDTQANRLLDTGNFILLETFKVSSFDSEFPQNTKMLYSLGQIQNGSCPHCQSVNSVEYLTDDDSPRYTIYIGECKKCKNKIKI